MAKRVGVVVLGDLERSPRMRNHAVEALTAGHQVSLIGYDNGNRVLNYFRSQTQTREHIDRFTVVPLSTQLVDRIKSWPKILYLLYAVLRIVIQTCQLLYCLCLANQFDYIIVQNPPGIPLIGVCFFVKILTAFCNLVSNLFKGEGFKITWRTRIIIDWHNYGWTIMQVNNVNKILVKIAKIYELFLGNLTGDYHLTVSEAMKQNLLSLFQFGGVEDNRKRMFVMYDKGTPKFIDINLSS